MKIKKTHQLNTPVPIKLWERCLAQAIIIYPSPIYKKGGDRQHKKKYVHDALEYYTTMCEEKQESTETHTRVKFADLLLEVDKLKIRMDDMSKELRVYKRSVKYSESSRDSLHRPKSGIDINL